MDIIFADIALGPSLLFWAFLAAVISSIFGSVVGGGGFLAQPWLLALGVPPHIVLASDVTSTIGSGGVGAAVFHKHGKIPYHILKWWLPGAVLGPFLGVWALAALSEEFLASAIPMVAITGVIAIAFGRGNIGDVSNDPPKYWQVYSLILGFVIGSLYGLGVGGMSMITTLLMLCLIRLDIKQAVGAKKIMMFVPAVFATIAYLQHGFLSLPLTIVLVIGAGLGGYIGSTWVIKADTKRLKIIFLVLVLVLSAWSLIRPHI